MLHMIIFLRISSKGGNSVLYKSRMSDEGLGFLERGSVEVWLSRASSIKKIQPNLLKYSLFVQHTNSFHPYPWGHVIFLELPMPPWPRRTIQDVDIHSVLQLEANGFIIEDRLCSSKRVIFPTEMHMDVMFMESLPIVFLKRPTDEEGFWDDQAR